MRENQVHWRERNMASARIHQNVILNYIIIMCLTDLTEMHGFAFQQMGLSGISQISLSFPSTSPYSNHPIASFSIAWSPKEAPHSNSSFSGKAQDVVCSYHYPGIISALDVESQYAIIDIPGGFIDENGAQDLSAHRVHIPFQTCREVLEYPEEVDPSSVSVNCLYFTNIYANNLL